MKKSTKKVKRHGKYDPVLKREIGRRYLAGEFSYQVAAEQYNLPGRDTVKEFVKWYRRELAREEQSIFPLGPHPKVGPGEQMESDEAQALAEENARLRAELHKSRLRTQAYKAMIEVAGDELGIDIVKKSAPKPSHD